jgi:hypothetical protein
VASRTFSTSAFSANRRTLAALRLSALGIATPSAAEPADAVRASLALQAQDYPGALWAIGLRTPGVTLAGVEAAHEGGAFVRSWPMRGTLHMVAPDDLGWMLSLTGERMVRSAAGRHRQLELSDADFASAATIARDLLVGGAHATRAEMLAAFDAGGVSTAGQRGVHLLGRLSYTGQIVLSGQKRYALLADWARHPRSLTRDEALRELALRYFTGHGPATVQDLAWWAGVTLTDARAGLAAARDELVELEVDGTTYLHRPGLEPAESGVHMLPGFDEYVLGYTDRSAQLAPEHMNTIVPGSNGMFLATIVVDGEIVGTWKKHPSAKRMRVTLEPFGSLSAGAVRAIRKALIRYGEFLEQPVELDD